MYNGYSTDSITERGALKLGVENFATSGIAGRGVLIDAGAYINGSLKLGDAITLEDFNVILKKQKTLIVIDVFTTSFDNGFTCFHNIELIDFELHHV